MNRWLVVVVALTLLTLAAAQTEAPNKPKHQVIEAKIKDKELLKMVTGKEFAIPQLRVYDRQGQQVADFSSSFEADTFKEDLDKVFRSPKPDARKPALKAELEILTDIRNKKLKELEPADFILVEYWADWCEPCKEQLGVLHGALEAHQELAINLLHVMADPTKLPGMKVIKEK